MQEFFSSLGEFFYCIWLVIYKPMAFIVKIIIMGVFWIVTLSYFLFWLAIIVFILWVFGLLIYYAFTTPSP